MAALRERAGVTVDLVWAERVRAQVVGGRHVANEGAYVTAAIMRSPPDTYAPTAQPPAWAELSAKLARRDFE